MQGIGEYLTNAGFLFDRITAVELGAREAEDSPAPGRLSTRDPASVAYVRQMRVLVASTAGAGHVGPLLPFVDAFVRRGDEMLLVVPPGLAATVAELGQPYVLGADPPPEELRPLCERFGQAPPEEAAVIANREIFGRLGAAAMLPTLRRAVREWRPHLVLREPCEYASAVAAEEEDVPHVQVAISLAAQENGSLALAEPVLREHIPDLPERLLTAPYLSRFPASLDPSPFPDTRRYRDAVPVAGPLAQWGDEREPLVYLTFGTVAGGLPDTAEARQAALRGIGDLPVRVLLTTGRGGGLADVGPLPPRVRVEPWVPQADVLAQAALVVCHGGSGTTFGALAAGVPLVVAPMFADQPANGRLVLAAGAGLVVDPVTEAGVRAAVQRVLGDDAHRQAAGRIAAEMRALPDADALLAVVAAV